MKSKNQSNSVIPGQQEDDNLINKNAAPNSDSERQWDDNDPKRSNVDSHKPQFERSDLKSNQEQRAGSGGSEAKGNPDHKGGNK